MSNPRWTGSAERLVATALHQADCEWDLDTCLEDCTHSAAAESILSALAGAGLLLPPGGEVREERSWSHLDGTDCTNEDCYPYRREESRTVTEWPDGTELLTPWRPIAPALDIPGSQT